MNRRHSCAGPEPLASGVLTALLTTLVTTACSDDITVPPEPEILDPAGFVALDSTRFSLQEGDVLGHRGWVGTITFTFTNVSNQNVLLTFDLGPHRLEQKAEDRTWEASPHSSGGAIPLASRHEVDFKMVAPGESLEMSYDASGARPESTLGRRWNTQDPGGTYRVVVTSVYWDAGGEPYWGEDQRARGPADDFGNYLVSEPFELAVER